MNLKKAKALRKEAIKLFGSASVQLYGSLTDKIYEKLPSGVIESRGIRKIYQDTKRRIKYGEL